MTAVCIPFPGPRPAAPSLPSSPELIGLHVRAENALATALHELRRLDATPQSVRVATARATRAATLLKRVCDELQALGALQ